MQANPNLLAFAYVVSLLEGENPAEIEYQENHIMIIDNKLYQIINLFYSIIKY